MNRVFLSGPRSNCDGRSGTSIVPERWRARTNSKVNALDHVTSSMGEFEIAEDSDWTPHDKRDHLTERKRDGRRQGIVAIRR